eukprot:UN26378
MNNVNDMNGENRTFVFKSDDLEIINLGILAYSNAGNWKDAWKIFTLLDKNDIRPNITSINNMLIGFSHNKLVEQSERLIESMKNTRF